MKTTKLYKAIVVCGGALGVGEAGTVGASVNLQGLCHKVKSQPRNQFRFIRLKATRSRKEFTAQPAICCCCPGYGRDTHIHQSIKLFALIVSEAGSGGKTICSPFLCSSTY